MVGFMLVIREVSGIIEREVRGGTYLRCAEKSENDLNGPALFSLVKRDSSIEI